jgi:MFS family permease
MAFIDGTVVNVALPALQSALHATLSDVQWVVESYALFLAALLLIGGVLGDVYGRPKVFAVGVALFSAASALCGGSPDIRWLVIARGVQGVGGTLLVPGSLALQLLPKLFEKSLHTFGFDCFKRHPVHARSSVVAFRQPIGFLECLPFRNVDIQPPKAPSRFSLRLDV